MKTKNNVQKAILKSLAVVTSLVIISITVNAQGLWKSLLENYNFNEIEFAMVDNNSIALLVEPEANDFEFILVPETEEALELEKWMTDESYFTTTYSMEEEIENPLELEDWMTNEALFNSNSIYFEVETEEALELENWMIKEELFTSNLEIDQPLELETWMVSEKIW